MLKVGCGRVSTREQETNSHALEQQISRLTEHGAERLYIDVESGRHKSRPQLDKLLNDIQSGEISEVIFTRIDRLSRNIAYLLDYVDKFQSYGVNIIFLDQDIDLSTAQGRFQLQLYGALAELESNHLSERIKHGKAYFRANQKASHPLRCYKVVDQHFVLNHDIIEGLTVSEVDIGLELIADYLNGGTLRRSLKTINQRHGFTFFCNPSALRRWLLSPVIRGHTVYFSKSKSPLIYENTHERLITDATYQQILDQLTQNHYQFPQAKQVYSLSGLVFCGVCGGGCVISNADRGRAKYYACHRYRVGQCSHKKWCRYELIESEVIKALTLKSHEILNHINTASLMEESELQETEEITALKQQITYLVSSPFQTPEFIALRQELEAKIMLLQSQQTMTIPSRLTHEQELTLSGLQDPDYWNDKPPDIKKAIFRRLVERIVILDGRVVDVVLKI